MRQYLILLAVLTLFSSFRFDLQGPWIETQKDNIILYTRPSNYSSSPSPDSLEIVKILNAQTKDISYINNLLKTNFNARVKIYLFNYDEAKAKIGTNAGGGAKVKIKEMYFAYNKDLVNKLDDFIGLHEMAHVIASNELGYPSTYLMNEGYSNAISNGYKLHLFEDGTIRLTSLEQWMSDLSKNNKILSPTALLEGDEKIHDDLFYPQAGYFIKWMISEYGVETTNAVYHLKPRQLKKKLLQITGKDFKTIEKEYLKYIEKFK